MNRSLAWSLAACLLGAPAALHAAPAAFPREALASQARDVSQYNLGKDGLALQGFDPVAYFPEGGGRPLKGLPELALVHQGVRYHFASEENRELFRKRPAKYEPRYGGWCAYAMASGEKVEIDPKAFVVDGDELFVFYKSLVNDTRKKWLRDRAELEPRADAAWAKLLGKKSP